MTQTVVTPQEVREAGQIIPLTQVKEVLATTEPLGDVEFQLDGTSRVQLDMPREWNEDNDIDAKPGTFMTACSIAFEETDSPIPLSKDALLKLTSSIGLNRNYVQKTPGPLIAVQANWWLNNGGIRGTNAMHLLTKDGNALAARKDGLNCFPNLPLIDVVEGQLHERFGHQELMADAKFHHDFQRTSVRIIVPDSGRVMPSRRNTETNPDRWSVGVQFVNSIMADPESRLSLSGYMFAWWCTNGAITQHGKSGTYNRRTQDQEITSVQDWTRSVTNQAMDALEPALDDVQALTEVSLEGELNQVLGDVFTTYKLPPTLRPHVTEALIESDDLTAYGLMQAITQAANDPNLSDHVAETAMSIGGLLPHGMTDRCESCHRVMVA